MYICANSLQMKKDIITLIVLVWVSFQLQAQSEWVAPQEAAAVKNPLISNPENLQKGRKIFQNLCAGCHGKTGKGDVPAMQGLQPKPTNFTTQKFQNQSDGAIFWKISEGRGMMASYKNMLSENERWAVVNYLRNLAPKSSTGVAPDKDNETPKTTPKKTIKLVDAFPFSQLINGKTTHIIPPKGFGFSIQHRFGATQLDKSFITNFMGLDLAANIRFSFEIPVTRRLQFEIGRTRYGKFYDINAKYAVLQQTEDHKMPVSVTVLSDVAITTEKDLPYSETATFADGKAFEYRFNHRLYYDTQVLISRKFSRLFSAQIGAEFLWRNLTPYSTKPKEKSYVIAVPLSMRFKTGMRSAISLEMMPNTHPRTMPMSLAYEVASSGNHVFQITLTNSDRILAQNLFFKPTLKHKDGFMLGFNLSRYF